MAIVMLNMALLPIVRNQQRALSLRDPTGRARSRTHALEADSAMNVELTYLALTSLLTGLLWAPYILNAIFIRGLVNAAGYPENPQPLSKWAQRLKAAHYNAVENLVVFAALVLIAQAAGIHDAAIATSAMVYFWARVVHAAAYTFAVPWVRTGAFLVGLGAQLCIAWHILR